MALAAAQVVDALAARLVPVAASGGRVHTSRLWPLADGALPAWRVTVADEQATRVGIDGLHEHVLEVNAAGYTRATADLDDQMHALAAAGLAALFATPAPYGLSLLGIDREVQTQGEAAVGAITLRVRALFFAYPQAPETITS